MGRPLCRSTLIVSLLLVFSACHNPMMENFMKHDEPTARYTVKIELNNEETGDYVSFVENDPSALEKDDVAAGTSLTLHYAVAAAAGVTHNLVAFDGVTGVSTVNSAGSGTRVYTVKAADASTAGIITITARFTHTNLTPDPIAFTNTTAAITVTYGDNGNSFTNTITTAHSGTGAITYASSETSVATVNGNGVVTILKAGSAVIEAHKAEDAVFYSDTKSYTLNIEPKALTISGVSATDRTYNGADTVVLTGGTLAGVVGSDAVSFTPGSGTMASADVGNDKAVATTIALTGTAAGNYTLIQPTNVTVNIAKATGTNVTAPTAASVSNNTITINAVSAAQADGTTAAVEYAIAASNIPPAGGWQTTLTFSGLNAGTTYYVFARAQDSTNYYTGTPSTGTAIITYDLSITLSVAEIENGDPVFGGGSIATIYRSGTDGGSPSSTFTVNVDSPALYSSFEWKVDPVGAGAAVTQTGGSSFKLDAANVNYNTSGGHMLQLTVVKDGIEYMVPILFTVAN